LEFKKRKDSIKLLDYNLDEEKSWLEWLDFNIEKLKNEWEISDLVTEEISNKSIELLLADYKNKIWWYPDIYERDPRLSKKYIDKNYILIFQISTENSNIFFEGFWVFTFFITEEDLIKKDFSKVLYNWENV
jgi:uncharacterized protein YwqG